MPAGPLQRVKEIFADASDLTGAARSAYLDKACGEDLELRARVEALLVQDDAEGGLFDSDAESEWALAPSEPPKAFEEGELLGERFRVLRYVGRGGMGEVYEAEDCELGGRVALKTLRPSVLRDSRNVSRFKREVQLARQVTHANVCRVFDVGRHRREDGVDVAFLTMEFLEGETLAARLKREGPMALDEAAPLIRQMAEGLQALHAKDIVHRDFKPGNVMLCGGAAKRCVVMDFGLAREAHEAAPAGPAITASRVVIGTPQYMAPEQLHRQRIGPWTDVYAFGLTACETLTGRHPLDGDVEQTDSTGRPDAVFSGLPKHVAQTIRRCLSVTPSERPATPLEVAAALTPRFARIRRAAGGRRSRMLGAGLAVFLVALPAALFAPALRVSWRNVPETGMAPWLQENFCVRFPNACALPAGRDVAFQSLEVAAEDRRDELIGQGLSHYIGESLYGLRSDKDQFCFHVRNSKKHLGVPLVLGGAIEIGRDRITVRATLKRDADQVTLRSKTFEWRRDDYQGLYEGLVGAFAEMLEYGIEPEARERWLAERPRDAAAYEEYLAGLGLLAAGEYESALDSFRAAQRSEGGGLAFSAAARGRGEASRLIFVHDKRPEMAQEAINAFNQASPSVELYRSWGALEQALGNHEAAVQKFRRALEMDPYHLLARQGLSHSYEALELKDRARSVLREAVELQPECWKTYNLLANFEMRDGRLRESERNLLEAIRLAPRNPSAYTNLAMLYLRTGRYAEAVEHVSRAARIGQEPLAFATLAKALLHGGCYDEAVESARYAVARVEQLAGGSRDAWDFDAFELSATLWEVLVTANGGTLETRGILEDVTALAAETLARRPTDVAAQSWHAKGLALTGRRAQALESLARLRDIAPQARTTYFCEAEVYEVLGDRGEALSRLSQALVRGSSVFEARQTPVFIELRTDPRYQAIVEGLRDDRVGESQAAAPGEPCRIGAETLTEAGA